MKLRKNDLEDLEHRIDKLEKEYADLEEIWKAEKATLQGAQQIKEALRTSKAGIGNRTTCR